jgi:hypothetical protein
MHAGAGRLDGFRKEIAHELSICGKKENGLPMIATQSDVIHRARHVTTRRSGIRIPE